MEHYETYAEYKNSDEYKAKLEESTNQIMAIISEAVESIIDRVENKKEGK